jgi:hypothetical protein
MECTSHLIGCVGVNTVLDFFTMVLQFYDSYMRIGRKGTILIFTSLKGESFC